MSVLAHENKGGHVIKRLQEEISREARSKHHDVTAITMALMEANNPVPPRCASALGSMLARYFIQEGKAFIDFENKNS